MAKSIILLQETATGTWVKATLCNEVTDAHRALWATTWCPVMEAHCAGRTLSDKPEDSHWDWKVKTAQWRGLASSHSFAVLYDRQLQGLMWVSDVESARLPVQFRKALLYIKNLATAPWNRSAIQMPPRYRGVGTALMDAAVQLSLQLGFRGRIGLHALPAAEVFYQKACGMTAMGRDYACENLTYFEMTEVQADSFRRDRGRR